MTKAKARGAKTTNEKIETVREVCAEMKDYYCYGCAKESLKMFSDRILSSYEREMAAKDAEIARLKDEIADDQLDDTLVMQCATCRHYDRKHHHCKYHDSLTNPSYVCVACWDGKYSKRKGESK